MKILGFYSELGFQKKNSYSELGFQKKLVLLQTLINIHENMTKKGLTTRPKKTGLRFLIYSRRIFFSKKNFQEINYRTVLNAVHC